MQLSFTFLCGNDEANNRLLAPLAFNQGLERLVLPNNRPPKGPNVPPYCWPRFDFMTDNHHLEHLTIEAWHSATPFEQGLVSLCRAMHRNRGLTTLDLSKYLLQTGHIDALTEMIGYNSGLHKMDISGGYISGADHLKFVPHLARNTTLKVLVLTPYSALAKKVTSTCSEIAAFVEGTLTQSNLKPPGGPCSALLPILATNHCLEHLVFHPSYGFSEEKKGTELVADKALQKRINFIAALNKAGRRYLVDVGPECKATGVNVLDRVRNNVDCVFYHLRENPSLCADGGAGAKRGHLVDVGPERKAAGVNVLDRVRNNVDCVFSRLREEPQYRTLCSLIVWCQVLLFVALGGLLAARRRRRRRRALQVAPPRARTGLGYVQFCRKELRSGFALRYANAHGAKDKHRIAKEAHHYLTNDLGLVRPLIWVERLLRG